jgi:membrane protease subunit HflK
MFMLKSLKYPLFAIIAFHLITVPFSIWYVNGESEQAVITTGGKVTKIVTTSGLQWKAPWPFQKVQTLGTETLAMTFGYIENQDGTVKQNVDDAKMVTGDENIVLADMVVQYRIVDPEKYLYTAEQRQETLFDASSAALRSIIGTSTVDDALTSGRDSIQAKVLDTLTQMMARYDMGIGITGVQLQDIQTPTEDVQLAFSGVTTAKEEMNKKINNAQKYKNEKLFEVEGNVSRLISEAEAEKKARIDEATGDVALFNSLYNAYVSSPQVTKERLMLEALEEVLPKAKVYITDGEGTTKYLPIDQIKKTQDAK